MLPVVLEGSALYDCEFDVVHFDPFYCLFIPFVQVENVSDELIVRNKFIFEFISKELCYDLRSIDLAECVVDCDAFLEIAFGKAKMRLFLLIEVFKNVSNFVIFVVFEALME
jgi:hypothetical protein